MLRLLSTILGIGTAALVVGGGPVMAQKAQDTLRYAINDMFPMIDPPTCSRSTRRESSRA